MRQRFRIRWSSEITVTARNQCAAQRKQDRVVAGHNPPPARVEKTKSITVKVEYDVQTPRGLVRREHRIYTIPKSGTSYEIIDPYTGKKLYMTFTF